MAAHLQKRSIDERAKTALFTNTVFALPTPGVGTAESQRLVFEEKPPLRGAPYSRQRHRRGTASEPRVGVYTSFHVMCERSQS